MGLLLFVAPPVFSFAFGLGAKRWSVACTCTVVALAVSLSGWILGWAGDSDTPALGGAITFAVIVGMPFSGAAWLGVWAARSGTMWRRGDADELVEVRLDVSPECRRP
jgi:hypothetical protein